MDPNQSTPTGQKLPASQPLGDMISAAAPQGATVFNQGAAVQTSAPTSSSTPRSDQPMNQPADQVAPTVMQVATPAIAEDVDLIEKEWVEKAKSIVTNTRNDPYAQNQELNRFKADYMQKRYNKDIKIEP